MSFLQKGVVKGLMLNAVQFRNVFYAQVDPVTPDTYQSLWNDYLDGFYDSILMHISNTCTIQTVEIYEKQTEWVLMSEEPFVKTGGNPTNEPLANQLAVVLIGKALQHRGFGRKFIGGITEGAVVGNTIIPIVLAALANTVLAYVSPIIHSPGGTFGPGFVDKAGAFHSFSSGYISSFLGTMRRRKPGLGI